MRVKNGVSRTGTNIGSGTGHPAASLNYFHDPWTLLGT
jgi:hypothetical protein